MVFSALHIFLVALCSESRNGPETEFEGSVVLITGAA